MLTELRNVKFSPVHSDTEMSNYLNILTPPSSSEDSPQSSMYYNSASPTSSLSPPHSFGIQIQPNYGLPSNVSINPEQPPLLRIIEQPIDRFRFRYKSEMTGTHGSLCGQNSDRSRRQTYPTIELCNWDKPAVLRCSIYQISTRDNDKPHPHRLIKKQGRGEVDDPHDAQINPEDGFIYTFHNMGIIHTAKKNIIPELIKKKSQLKREEIARQEGKLRDLTMREEIEIKGLAEAESKSINLNVVCLRFDAFYNDNGILYPICPPIYSQYINNLKSALTGELKIVRMDHCSSPAKGGREIFILVERVTKKNIKVRFFELNDEDERRWEAEGKFSDLDVHHQYAIVFKTPPYRDVNITNPVKVYVELVRPSDDARSDAREFTYTPSTHSYRAGAKRPRTNYESSSYDSSLGSDELPETINNLNIGNNSENKDILDNLEMQLSSSELEAAVNNIDSAEFHKLFSTYGLEYSSVTLDAAPKFTAGPQADGTRNSRISYNRQNTIDELLMAQKTAEKLREFVKTRPCDNDAVKKLNNIFQPDLKTNLLHVLIREKDVKTITFILKMIFVWKQYQLLNIRNEECESPLQIAIYSSSDEIVESLVNCKADVSVVDANQNTALHVAVITNASIKIFESLLSVENVKDFIDKENEEGQTALSLAIDLKNLRAVKLLCMHGANVNLLNKKNGFSPLRMAIEKEHVEITRYLLEHQELNPQLADFHEVNPLHAVFKKTNQELFDLVVNYMKNNGYCDIEVKKEIEEIEEDEPEEKFAVKLEQITLDELKEHYQKVTDFTTNCLEGVSELLDASKAWQDLAELLDLGHLTRTVLSEAKSSPTKILLKFAVETNAATILQIRDFLDNLDETQAVALMDEMVRSQYAA